MTTSEIITSLQSKGSEQIKKILVRHGAREPLFGVKVEDLKKIVKDVKDSHQVALELYSTGIYDAMYLAGLLAEPKRMDKPTLRKWVDGAYCYGLSEYTVAWMAAESPVGWDLALEWIRSDREMTAAAGWATLGGIVALTPDSHLKIPKLKELAEQVGESIHDSPNRVKSSMNRFLIALGSYVPELTSFSKAIAVAIGKVTVNMDGTACKVPYAPDYISKIEKMGRIGKKRKTVIC